MKIGEHHFVVVLPDGNLMTHYRTKGPRFFKTKKAAEWRGEEYVHENFPHDHENVTGWSVAIVKIVRAGEE